MTTPQLAERLRREFHAHPTASSLEVWSHVAQLARDLLDTRPEGVTYVSLDVGPEGGFTVSQEYVAGWVVHTA